jgi:hypothetical protein
MLRRLFTSRRRAAALGVAASVLVGDALAHIDLSSPEPREHGRGREPNSNLKQGPCGQEVNGRTDKVTVFEPGATVSVTWVETTNHRSYYRVAFDVDGDDAFPTFAGTGRGAQGIDPSGPCPVDGEVILAYDMDDRAGGSHTLEVRLPDVECERCTLQVVQFMYDTMRPYYFQCADLALRRARPAGDVAPDTVPSDTLPSGEAPLDAGARDAAAPAAPEDAGAVSTPRAAPGCWSQIAPSEPVPAANGADDVDDAEPAANAPPAAAAGGSASTATPNARRSDDGGCSLALGSTRSNAARHLPLVGAWAVWRRRQRRVRRDLRTPAAR